MTLCTSKFNRLWIKDLQKLINGGVRYTPTVHSGMLNPILGVVVQFCTTRRIFNFTHRKYFSRASIIYDF